MSQSEPKDPKLETEAEQSVTKGLPRQEKGSPNAANGVNPASTVPPGAEAVPAIASESARDDMNADVDADANADADADSEAETLIQSPAKKRNSVADGSTIVHQLKLPGSLGSETGSIILTSASDKENATRKRRRSHEEGPARSPDRHSSRRSSPLSSLIQHAQSDADSRHSDASDSEASHIQDDRQPSPNRIALSRKRRRPPSEIAASTSSHKRSKRNSVDTIERRETRSATYPRPSDDDNSPSPDLSHRREHRRGASTQSTPHELERRKRGRPPNIHTRCNRSVDRADRADRADHSSDESEPRTSRSRPLLHKFTSNDHDTMSPIKDVKTGPRKWKDKNGRTYLARACNNNDLEAAKARYHERPEDLNMEDNAGNTPLQIAALEGFEEIVEFLLSKGAEVNARNVDKDTPLLDAVENGHVGVIKLLLQYGANPRLANAKGDEPYEMVHPDDENYTEIRELLAEAKEKDSKKVAGVDAADLHARDGTSSRAPSAASLRDSPPIGPRSPPAFSSRRRTGRSESTRNDLLWQANTQENLAKLASKGDSQGVANILSILEKAETEAVIAAAKAGHEEVLQLLIAMGKPNPDPDPVRGSKMAPGYNTPILAAIGRGHPDVVKLLANQAGFNPTRRYRERTYFELAEERNGDRWEEEYNVLKQAYDKYAISKGRKPSSPRKTRDADRSRPRATRRSSSVNSGKRQMSSPNSSHRTLPTKTSDGPHRGVRKTSDSASGKRRSSGTGDTTEVSVAVASDADQTVAAQKKGHRTRRSHSDLPPAPSIDHEPTHKRRRLVTGKEHRSRQTASTFSDNEETGAVEVKQEDPPSTALKRSRNSTTPVPPDEVEDSRTAAKKRRTVLESSPEESKPRSLALESQPPPTPPLQKPYDLLPETSDPPNETEMKTIEDEDMIDRFQSEERHPPKTVRATQGNTEQAIKHESTPPTNDLQIPLSDTLPLTSGAEIVPHGGVAEPMDDASEESYSPPPAVEPPKDHAKEEAEREKQKEAERIAEEQRLKEEAERKAQEEKIAQEKAAEELRVKQEAEEKRRRQEEEAARRRREEEERQERQRQELETRRRLEQLEQERKRLEGLPIVLAKTAQMIDNNDPEVKNPQWLSKYLPLYSVKTRQLDPACEASAADDEWVPSFQVAGLLITKDLNLSSYTSFDKKPVTDHQRQCLWRVARLKLSYAASSLSIVPINKATEVEHKAEEKFMSMAELFWVRVSL